MKMNASSSAATEKVTGPAEQGRSPPRELLSLQSLPGWCCPSSLAGIFVGLPALVLTLRGRLPVTETILGP